MTSNYSPAMMKFIEENIQLIDQNRFEELFKIANSVFSPRYIGQLGEILLTSGIDVLTNMLNIPEYFLRDSVEIKELTIPSNIETIGGGAFANSAIEHVVFEDGVRFFEADMFFNCSSLKTVEFKCPIKRLPTGCFCFATNLKAVEFHQPSLVYIGNNCFSETVSVPSLFYPDTKQQFLRKVVSEDHDNLVRVVCSDGMMECKL